MTTSQGENLIKLTTGLEHEKNLLATIGAVAYRRGDEKLLESPDKIASMKERFSDWEQSQLEGFVSDNTTGKTKAILTAWKVDFAERLNQLAKEAVHMDMPQLAKAQAEYATERKEDFKRQFGNLDAYVEAENAISVQRDRLFGIEDRVNLRHQHSQNQAPGQHVRAEIDTSHRVLFEQAQTERERMRVGAQALVANYRAVRSGPDTDKTQTAFDHAKHSVVSHSEHLWQNVSRMELIAHGETKLWREAGKNAAEFKQEREALETKMIEQVETHDAVYRPPGMAPASDTQADQVKRGLYAYVPPEYVQSQAKKRVQETPVAAQSRISGPIQLHGRR